jgi:hypothetical protein
MLSQVAHCHRGSHRFRGLMPNHTNVKYVA